MSNPMRLGIVGFGRLAQSYYVPALRRMSDIAVMKAITDPNAACRAAATTLMPDAVIFESQTAMLDAEPLEGILVASPPAAHPDSLRELNGRAPLAVFMEKPLVSPGQIDAISAVTEEVRSRIMVNFNRRFWHRYLQIAEVVQSGRIGSLQSAELELQVDVSKWLSVTQHRIEKGQGGALYDLGSQLIDLAGFIVGEKPTEVRAEAQSKRWEADHVTIHLSFASHKADVRCRVAYDSPTRERILVRGSAGVVRIDNPNMAVHFSETSGVFDKLNDFITFAGHAARRHTSMSRLTIELALRAFVARWSQKEPMSPSFADGAFSANALEAANRSIQFGKPESVNANATEAVA